MVESLEVDGVDKGDGGRYACRWIVVHCDRVEKMVMVRGGICLLWLKLGFSRECNILKGNGFNYTVDGTMYR